MADPNLASFQTALQSGQGGASLYSRMAGQNQTSNNVFDDLFQGLKNDFAMSVKSIPHLVDAVQNWGKDDGADEETKALRRRAVALAATTASAYGLSALAAALSDGAAVPFLAPVLKIAQSAAGQMAIAGGENVMYNRLDTAPGQPQHDVSSFLQGAAIGGVFHGLGSFFKNMAASRRGLTPGPSPVLPEPVVDNIREAGGETVSSVQPIKTSTMQGALKQYYLEQNTNHPDLAGTFNRDKRLEFGTTALGKAEPIKSFNELTPDEVNQLTETLRVRRGEAPLKATAANVGPKMFMRVSKTMSTEFPDASHAQLYRLGESGAVDPAQARVLSAQLGIPAEQVAGKAVLYHNLTNLAAEANRGRGVMFKMPDLNEAVEQMPDWLSTAREGVASRVTSGRRIRTAGDVAVDRASRVPDPTGEVAVRASRGKPTVEAGGLVTLKNLKDAQGNAIRGTIQRVFKDPKSGRMMAEIKLSNGKVRRAMMENVRPLATAGEVAKSTDISAVQVGTKRMQVVGSSEEGLHLRRALVRRGEGGEQVFLRGPVRKIPWDVLDRRLNEDVSKGKVVRVFRGEGEPEVRGTPGQRIAKATVQNKILTPQAAVAGMRGVLLKRGGLSGQTLNSATRVMTAAVNKLMRDGDVKDFQDTVLKVAFAGKESLKNWDPTKLTPEMQAAHAQANAVAQKLHSIGLSAMKRYEVGPAEATIKNPTKGKVLDTIDELFVKHEAPAKPTQRFESTQSRREQLLNRAPKSSYEQQANKMLAKSGFFEQTKLGDQGLLSGKGDYESLKRSLAGALQAGDTQAAADIRKRMYQMKKTPKLQRRPSEMLLQSGKPEAGGKSAPQIVKGGQVIGGRMSEQDFLQMEREMALASGKTAKAKELEDVITKGMSPAETYEVQTGKQLKPVEKERFNYYVSNLGDPEKGPLAKMHLKEQFGAEFATDEGPKPKASNMPKHMQRTPEQANSELITKMMHIQLRKAKAAGDKELIEKIEKQMAERGMK